MKNKKRKVSMRTRRKIFYTCCIVILYIILITCVRSCKKAVSEPVEVAAAETLIAVETEAPAKVGRYAEINIDDWDIDEMAAIIYLEARNQSAKGQQAVAEVILNRVLHSDFPNSVSEVIHEDEFTNAAQFSGVAKLSEANPTVEQYRAINAALYGEPVLPLDVVFFSRRPENNKVWGEIDDHIFCYAYKWE